ncbi:MAG: hypothetical protein K9H49_03950 [Bacteroidales bacterium]|nr:hypothetical protein [Bacteroidales bacterium]MCF8390064.1 hypothetical protein [Bacteroidales bacterium]
MKNLILLISSLTLLFVFPASTMSSEHNTSAQDSIHVWTSADMLSLSSILADEYNKSYPDAKIIVSESLPADMDQKIKGSKNIALISNDKLSAKVSNSSWKLAVGRDIIVPVMNSTNPYLDEIYKTGISPEDFANAYSRKENKNWGSLLNKNLSVPLTCYCLNNEAFRLHLADFLKSDPVSVHGNSVENAEEMLTRIKNDKYAIGFCKLVDILNIENKELKEGLSLIPIDFNNNQMVDYFENIYANSSDFERGIWIGKYPKALYSTIYAVAGEQPAEEAELAFIEWLITDGQQFLLSNGYSELLYSERQGKIQSLYASEIPVVDIQNKPLQSLNILFIMLIMLASASLIFLVFLYIRNLISGIKEEEEVITATTPNFGAGSINVPGGLFFDKSHTWAFMEKDGNVRIGIDDFLQHVTGPITKIKMKNPGESIKKGETFLSLVQHGKHLNIQSPVSGVIRENNLKLNSNSSIINSDPYSEGWVYVIESANWLKEIKAFLMGETYKTWLKNEFSRLKDFLSSVIKPEDQKQLQFVMQDGGELKDSLLEMCGPEIWEEFQIRFINQEQKFN